ncbi:hypothetical protein [Haliscomenobacter hydrossis]|uniref:Uncharacterized protein n=1 Tax=Haliscomenobacter hydrossis (strain ATCC 27775 / DSM 1100 / LMG 10767 / O) TaxID=760192 RepID=F4KS87_HALH1|nr:hypothetical protein [Haliscomenobacter hydrossis]AEE52332.1 hypothetical protein Halhy_4492 [Haliscomenobacter hydrossis DSM 1100]
MSKKIYYKGFEAYIWNFKQKFGDDSISHSFTEAMIGQLCKYFLEKTGIDMGKSKGKIGFAPGTISSLGYSIDGNIGKLEGHLICFYMEVGGAINWKTYDGSIIHPKDQVDEKNIEFWFEDLNVEWAKREWKLYSALPKLGFTLPSLHYKVLVDHFNEHFYVLVAFKSKDQSIVESVANLLYHTCNTWNDHSLTKSRKLGIVHNCSTQILEDNYLRFYIDFGSAHEKLLKQILEALNDIPQIEKVTITSYPDEE